MLQLAIVFKPQIDLKLLSSQFLEIQINFETLPPQKNIFEIANEMGITRAKHSDLQSICILNISTTSPIAPVLESILQTLSRFEKDIDFLILPQSAQASEWKSFLSRLEQFKDLPELCFIQLLRQNDRLFTLGFESWGKPDIILSEQENDQEMLTQAAEITLQSDFKEKEKIAFESGTFKAVKENADLHPEGLQNSYGMLRLVKQI